VSPPACLYGIAYFPLKIHILVESSHSSESSSACHLLPSAPKNPPCVSRHGHPPLLTSPPSLFQLGTITIILPSSCCKLLVQQIIRDHQNYHCTLCRVIVQVATNLPRCQAWQPPDQSSDLGTLKSLGRLRPSKPNNTETNTICKHQLNRTWP